MSEGGGEQGSQPPTCPPCRGTGKLISSLGGDPHHVQCPWCGGSGELNPGRDAQEEGPAERGT